MRFTDILIKNLKPQAAKFYQREANGFAICVYPSGVKTWFYIFTFEKKRYSVALGNYPTVSLADARSKYNELWETWKSGKNPVAVTEPTTPEVQQVITVESLVGEYLRKHAKPKKRSWKTDERILNKEVIPLWGKLPLTAIKKRDVVLLLEGIVERGAPATSNCVLMVTRKMFNFAIERDIMEARDNPFLGVKALSEIVRGNRTLTVAEIKTLWGKLDLITTMEEKTKRALKLILVTGQRPGEVSGMHSDEIDGSWWTIPVERSKNKKAHRVYLTPLALGLIEDKKGFVFETRMGGKAMRRTSLANALKRNFTLGTLEIPPFHPHDLRRTVATHMPRIGIPPEHRERVINHTMSTLEGTYDLYAYEKEKQRALERWSRELERIVTGAGGKVIPISRQVAA